MSSRSCRSDPSAAEKNLTAGESEGKFVHRPSHIPIQARRIYFIIILAEADVQYRCPMLDLGGLFARLSVCELVDVHVLVPGGHSEAEGVWVR